MAHTQNFTGVLAVLHTPTADGRCLEQPAPALHRPLPLPLVRPGESAIGRIDRVWLDGDLIHYAGVLNDGHPEAERTAAEIRAGRLVGMLDADDVKMRPGADGVVLMRGWRVVAATLMPSDGKAWPEVSLTLDDTEPS